MTVYNATLKRWGETFLFASIDNEIWLPINRPLEAGDEEQFQQLLDGDGNMKPMAFHKNWLDYQAEGGGHKASQASVVFHDPK